MALSPDKKRMEDMQRTYYEIAKRYGNDAARLWVSETTGGRADDLAYTYTGTAAKAFLDPGSLPWSDGRSPNRSNKKRSIEEAEYQTLVQETARAKQLTEILESIQKEPLILQRIDRISKDKKHAFIKKGDQEIRINIVPDLKEGNEVLLHPKTMQIVEHLGRPPLKLSPFAPAELPNVKWDDIGGLEQAKQDLIEAIEMPHKHGDMFKAYGKRQIKGVLLSGPPGCGKTMLGKATASALADIYGKERSRTGFLYVKGPEILNQYVGQTEATIREIFDDARRHHEEYGYPAVVFIDEADAILATRGSRNVGIGNTIVPMFLTEMDGLEANTAIVVLATNRPDILDPAIVRDGRIDRKIAVTRPSKDNAIGILAMYMAKVPIHKSFDRENLVEGMATEVFADHRRIGERYMRDCVNGAMLAGLVDLAVSGAIHRDVVKGNKKPSGVMDTDVLAALDRMCHQNNGLSV